MSYYCYCAGAVAGGEVIEISPLVEGLACE